MPVESRNGYSDSSSNDTLRKYSEDHCRKHLADLVEADEETETTGAMPYDRLARVQRKVSTSSTYSLASLEALWEKHPRRLSEAGLRRSSDHSVVLTEDTDSFIIGDRVWVGGSKPGQIAYIGETQFAPGEWAGIVLDDPIGKNDGSVAGTRYFQCSERRGVFSRLTRLTRTPLAGSPASEAGDAGERPRSAARARRSGSPQGSVRSVFSSKMNSSINSSFASGELKLGERVIVSSSQGSKAGTLRFVGATDFATGSWCGVELDDPIGKNDGSVEGKRYFECAPRFGLFAPVSKVSRSPSNRKPGVCAIHSRNGAATPLRRSSSRDSLTSLGTSLASSRVAPRSVVRLGVTSLAGAQVGWTPSREALRRREPPRASSEPSLLTLDDLRDKTLLVRDIDERRCCVDVLREPRVCIDVSAKVSKSSSRKSDSSSQPLNWLVSKNACFYHSSRASCANKHSIKLKARAKSASNRRTKPSPELVYEITLKQVKLRKWKSEVLLKNSRWSSSEGSQSDWTPGGELVTVHGRPAVYARTSHVGAGQSANLYIDLPPRPHTYFSNFGKSYHYSCMSPFEFKFPYIVYI